MRLAVLEAGVTPPALKAAFGGQPRMFEDMLGLGPSTQFAITEGRWPDRPGAFDAYIVTGSAAGVYDPLPWIGELMAFLRAARGQAALVGICFGHQVMAQAFGGQVIKSPKGWGVGLHKYEVVETQPWMDPVPRFAIPASHQDQVVIRPPGAVVIGASAFTPFAALAYGDDAISFQGHPEFDPAFAQALLRTQRGVRVSEDQADAALASLERPNDRKQVGDWIRRYLEARSGR